MIMSTERSSVVATIMIIGTIMIHRLSSTPIVAKNNANVFNLLLIHNNDMHSRFLETNEYSSTCSAEQVLQGRCFGGFARTKQAVREAKMKADKMNVSSIFLNAGDSFQGSVFFSILKWEVVADLINTLGIDVMSLGNHEFDDGISGLVPYLKNITIPVVTANIDLTLEPELQLPILTPSKVLQVTDKKIGIVGYLTPETKDISNAGKVIILDEISSIRKEAQRLKSEGVDIIIALGHSGYEVDLKIAKQIPEVSVVVGGHSHSLLYTPKENPPSIDIPVSNYPHMVTQSSGKIVPVVQAGCYTKYLGKLWLTFDDKGDVISAEGNTLLLNSSIKQDETILKEIKKWSVRIDQKIKDVVAISEVFLEGDETNCRFRECNLGNFIADAFVDYVAERHEISNSSWTSAPIAIVQGGSIRSNLNVGNVTYGDLLTFIPFENELVKVTLCGKTLIKILEHAVHRFVIPAVGGEFLQFSGLHVKYDVSRPPYSRVVSVMARCGNCSVPNYSPVKEDTDYVVIMSQYLREGKDGYDMIKDEMKHSAYVGVTDIMAITIYMKRQTFVHPEIEDRIIIIQSPIEAQSSASSFVSINVLFASLLYAICSFMIRP